ncbi:MAG: large conductance mechanosensitive channel protein MscL [Oscillospiraceae bacterium]|nr:large conductance mechanosensitive channel protein MscL [Oscillospiraceae bacterium]
MAEEKKGFIAEFKEFISRGNVMDMAVGVVVGGAFTAIVNALIESIINPIITIIAGQADFSAVTVGIFPIGTLISAIINFLLISLVVFTMVKSLNTIKEKASKKPDEEPVVEEEVPAAPTEAELLAEIRDLLKENQAK